MSADPLNAVFLGFLARTREYAFVCIDPQGVITHWLGAAERVLGYTEREALGLPASVLFTAEDREKGFDKHELEVALHDSRAEDDRWHVRRDGTRIWVTGSVDAIRDAQGELIGYVKVLRDRTDLRTQVVRLERQSQEAEAALARTRAFLRTLGHELRNPLAPIANATAILPKVAGQDARIVRAAEIIVGQLAALRRMADDLSEAARLDAGKVRLHLRDADLRDVLKDAWLAFDPSAKEKGVDLQALLPRGALPVRIDPPRFQQATANLISNAINYTPAGGRVWIKATQEGDEIVTRIEDTGIGIDAGTLPRLFELFSRGMDAGEFAPGGMGIGLAVVREVVELHGGTVQARSPGPGKGSEFTIRLPAAQPGPEAGLAR